uniref:hypothetical protein n=1 Tax=Deinococcus sp. TaxID=47478 RepID=UPI0025DD6D40
LDVPLEAQRYLQGCITAVAVAKIRHPERFKALTGELSCDDLAFDMQSSYYGASSSPAVTGSRVELGNGGLDDYRVSVTDITGRVWTGSQAQSPRVKPRPPSAAWQQKELALAIAPAVMRACQTSLALYTIEVGTLEADWNGSSCADPRLKPAVASLDAVDRTEIKLLPGMAEGYQLTVWPKGGAGEPLIYPEKPTPLPPPTPPEPVPWQTQVFQWLGGPLVLGLLYLMTVHWWSSRILGALGLLLGALVVLMLISIFSSVSQSNEFTGYFALGLMLALGGSLVFGGLRLAVWRRREAWWVSLGNGFLSMGLLALGLTIYVQLLS